MPSIQEEVPSTREEEEAKSDASYASSRLKAHPLDFEKWPSKPQPIISESNSFAFAASAYRSVSKPSVSA